MSELPEGWVRTTLGDTTTHRSGNGKLIKGKQHAEAAEGLFPAFSASGQDIWVETPEYSGAAVVVSAVGARCGKAFLASGQWSAVANTHIVWPEAEVIDPRWLWLRLNDENFWIKGGSAQPFVKVAATFERELELPPLAEQRRIVAKLDALTARTARARADLDRIPALTARYKQVVLAKAFSGELTGSDGAGWTEVSISEIAEVGTGSTPKRSQAAYYHDGVVPWVTSSVVNRAYVDSADQFITEQALRETNCKVFQPGTLLVAMYGEGQTRGRVSVLGIAAATNQALAAISITCDDVVRRDYVYWFLRSQYLALRSAAAGGVQPNLNLGIIKATRIPVPPLTEQVEIVHLVDRAFGELDRMAAEATSALRLIDRLDQAMLAKAFMGELVSQNPSDEPASVLLDRIRAERASAPKGTRGRRKAAA